MPEPSSTDYTARQSRLSAALQACSLDALALNPGPSLVYLTGLSFHLMERPVVAVFRPGEPLAIVLPELETAKLESLHYPIQAFSYGEDPAAWGAVFARALKEIGLAGDARIGARSKTRFGVRSNVHIGVEPTRLRVLELRLLEQAAPHADFPSAEDVVASLRMVKDAAELSAMREAVRIAQDALLATLPVVKMGVTEKEIAAELTLQLLHRGSDPEMPFTPIVSGGPNSANPHATPTHRPLQPGDLLVIDWGAAYQGYISDITRTFAIPPVDPEMERIARIVLEANTAGRLASTPEVACGEVDEAARRVIEAAGYGQYFTHRTGHGIGMEGHEGPYIRSGSEEPLQPGMTFTVEPGIYLRGRNGVRIEDDMVITADGAETLTSLPRELIVLG